jgi:TonB family protein
MRLLFVLAALILIARGAAAQDSIAAARELYASAAYEEALTELERAKPEAPQVSAQVEQYRAFSLFALGRTAEAERAAEAAVRQDPLARLDARDTSPKVEALFKQVQKRLLPGLVRDRFRAARATLDEGQLDAAMTQLAEVQTLLAEAKALDIRDEGLTDLGVLVSGFSDLTRMSMERRAATARQAAEVAPVVAPPPAPAAPRVYNADDRDVVAPAVIVQSIPPANPRLTALMVRGKRSGVVEVRIDETGAVEHATMIEPVNDVFDTFVLTAVQNWRYKPATREGAPVKYVKRIAVSLEQPTREDD